MTVISGSSPLGQQTVSAAGVQAKLAGTPLAAYANELQYYAQQYGVDVNWALAYLQWENGFGLMNGEIHFSVGNNNPWDMLVYREADGSIGNWGAVGSDVHVWDGNRYEYAVYPNMTAGIEAGFRQWRRYLDDGYTDWHGTLCRAVSGSGPCNETWVANVIRQGQLNAQGWPIAVGGETPDSGPETGPGATSGPTLDLITIVGVAVGLLGLVYIAMGGFSGGSQSRRQVSYAD